MAKHAAVEKTVKKPRRRFRGLVITMVSLLATFGVLCVAAGIVFWKFLDYDYDSTIQHMTNEQLGITNTTLTKKVTNIVLFGVDSRSAKGYSGNTDSIMIVSLDEIHNKIKITSIMRDTLVHMDEHGYRKINSAYARGGPELAIKTINEAFNMNIRHYATVNFAGMIDIVDAIGGVEIEITEAERQLTNDVILYEGDKLGTEKKLIRKAGLQTLTGVQAVYWARLRTVSTAEGVNNDFGRTDRQRVVMEALFDRITGMGAAQYPALVEALLPYVRTSLSHGDILGMAETVLGDTTFEQTRIPQTEFVINADYREKTGSSTVYYNLEYAAKVLHAFIYDDMMPADYIEQNGVDKTPWAK
ncbi:MAG: LytR family transcriptional regulator [Ruminococcaceae bacterium]|nr:LytR family transcriptional regulator [Oscillospiraceae bacterium]